jgi:hypothetical protein
MREVDHPRFAASRLLSSWRFAEPQEPANHEFGYCPRKFRSILAAGIERDIRRLPVIP